MQTIIEPKMNDCFGETNYLESFRTCNNLFEEQKLVSVYDRDDNIM